MLKWQKVEIKEIEAVYWEAWFENLNLFKLNFYRTQKKYKVSFTQQLRFLDNVDFEYDKLSSLWFKTPNEAKQVTEEMFINGVLKAKNNALSRVKQYNNILNNSITKENLITLLTSNNFSNREMLKNYAIERGLLDEPNED